MRVITAASRFAIALFLFLGGCALDKPDTYSTINGSLSAYNKGGYESLIRPATVKQGFTNLLVDDLCKTPPSPLSKYAKDSSSKSQEPYQAKWCADNVTRYTIDQCAALVGGQNRLAARFTEFMLPFLAVTGLASDVAAGYAISSQGSNTAAAAVIAAIIAGSGTMQRVIPSQTNLRIAAMTDGETQYLSLIHFNGNGLPCLKCRVNNLIYSELHDALLSSCSGLNP